LTPRQLGSLQYFFTALAVVVFLVELRVRKNEVLRALRRLVGSVDKYYIRYMCAFVYRPLGTLLCCHIHDLLFPHATSAQLARAAHSAELRFSRAQGAADEVRER